MVFLLIDILLLTVFILNRKTLFKINKKRGFTSTASLNMKQQHDYQKIICAMLLIISTLCIYINIDETTFVSEVVTLVISGFGYCMKTIIALAIIAETIDFSLMKEDFGHDRKFKRPRNADR